MRTRAGNRRKGNALVEFALVSIFLVPLLLGTVNVGMNLSRSIQTTQVSRDAGHMYVRNVDFSIPANQDIVVRLAQGLNMTRTAGNGVVTLSRVLFVGPNECAGAGLTLAQCVNVNQPVFTQRIVIGNATLRPSDFGTPPSNLIGSNGNIAALDYLTNPAARTNGFSNLLALQPMENAFVSEAYFISPEWDFPGAYTNTSTYARTIF